MPYIHAFITFFSSLYVHVRTQYLFIFPLGEHGDWVPKPIFGKKVGRIDRLQSKSLSDQIRGEGAAFSR